jgi:pyruvate,orthophosphate dikinase
MYFALQDELMRRAAGDLMPTRLFYDFLKTSLETNARIAENLSAFMKSQQGALMKEADSAPRDKSASGGAFFTPFADFNQKDRWVYTFGAGKADGSAQMREVLGGKGANLAEMSNLGLPVPPGFTISTEMCALYNERGRSFPDSLTAEVDEAIAAIGRQVGAAFGDPQNPLLVSVRSGARASMPGMMDTVLNLGLNDETADWRRNRATTVSLMIPTAVSSRCIPTSFSELTITFSRKSSIHTNIRSAFSSIRT